MQARLAAVLVAVALLTGSPRGEEPPPPLHNEDVVRMLVAGKSAKEIVRIIETDPVDFDLSPEMLAELQSASVPRSVLDAMQSRMTEIERSKVTKEKVEDVTTGPKLRVHFQGSTKLHVPDWGTAALGEKLKLDLRGTDREIRDVAYFVACTTEEHLPEQWRSKSPLGRDYVVPKHQMLLFQPGAAHLSARDVATALPDAFRRKRDDGSEAGWFELTLPPDLAVDLSQDDPHDLLVGIAIDIQANWHPLVSVRKKKVEIGPTGVDLYVTIEGKAEDFDLRARLDDKPAAPQGG